MVYQIAYYGTLTRAPLGVGSVVFTNLEEAKFVWKQCYRVMKDKCIVKLKSRVLL